MQPEAVGDRSERAPDHLRAEARAAHPEQQRVLEALRLDGRRELLELARMLEHLLADREPAKPVAYFRHPRTAPERLVPLPDALGHLLVLGLLHPLGDRRLELVGQHGLDRLRAAGHNPLAGELHAGDERVEGLDELGDAVEQELLRHVSHVDARLGQPLELGGRVLISCGARDLELLLARQESGHRHRVHRVWRHQTVHILCLGVARVLHAGGRPQRPLDGAAGLAQLREALAQEHLLEALVGGARVRHRGDPEEVLLAGLGEPLVDLGVHARDEEAGHRVDVERLARLLAALHPTDVGLGDRAVGLDREQQRYVDVDAGGDRLLDRGHALLGARDLDHQVRPVDARPVVARLGERALGVVRERRLDLERDEAVRVVHLVPDGAQHVAGELHVEDRELVVDLARAQALLRELGHLLVVVGGAEDRLLEDRRVRGHAAQRVLAHEPLELAPGDHAAPDLVEPDAGAGRGQRREPLVDACSDAHRALLSIPARPPRARSRPVLSPQSARR